MNVCCAHCCTPYRHERGRKRKREYICRYTKREWRRECVTCIYPKVLTTWANCNKPSEEEDDGDEDGDDVDGLLF